jgi:hypothetical protein
MTTLRIIRWVLDMAREPSGCQMSSTDGCAPRAQRTGAPLNELIVATLIDSLTRGDTTEQPGDAREEQARLIERILGDLAVSLDVSNLPLTSSRARICQTPTHFHRVCQSFLHPCPQRSSRTAKTGSKRSSYPCAPRLP